MEKRFIRVIALTLLLAFAGTGLAGCGGGEAAEAIFYLKDDGLYYTSTEKIAPKLITADCYKGQDSGYSYYGVSNLICQDNKNGLFYPVDLKEKKDYPRGTWTLRYQKLNKPEDTAIEIDTDIMAQAISADGELVTYIKDGTLYQSDCAGNIEKIHDQVLLNKPDYYDNNVKVSNDGKLLYYLDAQDMLFVKQADQQEEMLGEQVSQFYLSGDYQTVYFLAGETLCKKTVGQAVEQLAEQVEKILKVYASGEVYYMCKDEYEVYLSDYIENDLSMEGSDLLLIIGPMTTSRIDHKLYYYDGTHSQKFAETTSMLGGQSDYECCKVYYDDYYCADNAPVMVYAATHPERMEKVKLSDLQDNLRFGTGEDYVFSEIGEALRATYDANVAVDATNTVFDEVTVKNEYNVHSKMYPAPDGTSLFYIKEQFEGSWGEEGKGDLYQCQIIDGVPQEAMFVDEIANTNVWLRNSVISLQDGIFAYYKNCKNYDDEKYMGDLYIDQSFVDSNVDADGFWIHEGIREDRLYYMTNWNWGEESGLGTLKCYMQGQITTIAEDVQRYDDFTDGSVLCFQNYNSASEVGDLYFYRNGNATLVDEEVDSLVWSKENPTYGLGSNYGYMLLY